MIKLATMSSACPDWTLDEVVAGMKRHGYQGFEPRVEWDHACGIEAALAAPERRDIRRRMEDEGLGNLLHCYGCADGGTPDVAERGRARGGL